MYKVDNSKFTKFMRHIDSIFSGSKDNLLSSRQACCSQHYSHPVVKAISSSSPGGLELLGVIVPASWRREAVLSQQLKSRPSPLIVCAGESPTSPLSSLPAPSGWGRRCVYLVGGDGEGRWV